jgi:hypothetical protein
MMIMRDAIVIDNNDPDKKSRIKVQILPEQKGITDETLYRWILPMFNAGSDAMGEHNPPEKDSHVQVLILDKYWLEQRYINNWFIEGYNKYTDWTDNSSNITDLTGSQTYPEPRFKIFPDGSLEFRNYTTGEKGWLNSNGSYIIFDVGGNIFCYSKDKNIKLYNDETSILLDNTNKLIDLISGTTEIKLDGNTGIFDIIDQNGNEIVSDTTGITINNNYNVLI